MGRRGREDTVRCGEVKAGSVGERDGGQLNGRSCIHVLQIKTGMDI